MKVGIDGVLLGAWVQVHKNLKTALDIGTGTGLLALMLAQKSKQLNIDAVELDADACRVATQNVATSAFSTQVRVMHVSFQEYARSSRRHYDVIVSNPPFFDEAIKPADSARKTARHNDALPLVDFISGAARLLKNTGTLYFIYTSKMQATLEQHLLDAGLHVQQKVYVKPSPEKEPNRVMYAVRKTPGTSTQSTIAIREKGRYSDVYREWTRDFYLDLK